MCHEYFSAMSIFTFWLLTLVSLEVCPDCRMISILNQYCTVSVWQLSSFYYYESVSKCILTSIIMTSDFTILHYDNSNFNILFNWQFLKQTAAETNCRTSHSVVYHLHESEFKQNEHSFIGQNTPTWILFQFWKCLKLISTL